MSFDELKNKALAEHEEIEKAVEFYGCSYFDAKHAVRISKENNCDMSEALKIFRGWKSSDHVPFNGVPEL